MSAGTVIVGAGLGGIRVAANLRQAGYSEPITVIGDEDHPPYDRPPLSKAVLRGERDLVELKPARWYTENHIQLRLGAAVGAVDTAEHTVSVGDGESVDYDTLVLATGLDPAFLPDSVIDGEFGDGVAELRGVHVLRTADDSTELRAAAVEGAEVVVIGAGFIGCEAAASMSMLGARVTVVEPAPSVLHAALGPTIGARVEKLHADRGVTIRTGVGADGLRVSDGAVTGVRLADGSTLDADLVLLGIGSTPNTTLAESMGLDLAERSIGGGIACDAHGRTSVPGVYALGDVANWSDEAGAFGARVEHWNHVVEQSKVVAAAIVAEQGDGAAENDAEAKMPEVHYFWTDQFDVKIQLLGSPRPDDDVHLVSEDGDKFLAYFSRDGRLTGVVGAGQARVVMGMRATIAEHPPVADLL